MGEYEPNDSRKVTQGTSNNPVEPERTGRREEETRERARAEQQEAGKRPAHDPAATNDPQAIDNPPGDPRPEYDQYEVNQAGSVNRRSPHAERRAGQEQGDAGQSQETNGMKQQQQRAKQKDDRSITETGDAQAGYGNAKDGKGRSEQDAAKGDAAGKDPVGETSPAPDERARADGNPPLYEPGKE